MRHDKIDTIKGIKTDISIKDLFSFKKIVSTSKLIFFGKRLGKYQLPPKPQRKELIIVKNDKIDKINISVKVKYFIKLLLYETALTKKVKRYLLLNNLPNKK